MRNGVELPIVLVILPEYSFYTSIDAFTSVQDVNTFATTAHD